MPTQRSAKLTDVVRDIQVASASVRAAANDISQGNDDLSRRTESQAANLEEAASSMEEMTQSVATSADRASNAEQGGDVVRQAVAAMESIHESSERIAAIVGVIDDIAFQTNLLALNASVEAARAGEQGRGFAVVAREVRNLAGHSAKAAGEIKDLIEDSVARVAAGSRVVNASGETLTEIVDSVNETVAQISNASHEQPTGIQDVNRAVVEIDSLTQQNAVLVRNAADGSRSLSNEADNLGRLMDFFTLKTAEPVALSGARQRLASVG